jgi:tetratricopeptide (TPR) repeat protein
MGDAAYNPFGLADARLASQLVSGLAASGHYAAAIAGWRENAAWMFHRCGVSWHELFLLIEVMDDFMHARGKGDPVPQFHRHVGHLIQNRSPFDMAWQCYAVGLGLAPGHAETLYNLATLVLRRGDRDRAYAMFEAASRLPAAANAQAHAFITANAQWRCGELLEEMGRDEEAAERYRTALAAVGGFGPDQVKYPRLLQHLHRLEDATRAFEGMMSYSHRYAPEFIPPASGIDLMPPNGMCGAPPTPLSVLRVAEAPDGAAIVSYAGLYYRLPPHQRAPETGEALLRMAVPRGLRWIIRPLVRCAPSLDQLQHQG